MLRSGNQEINVQGKAVNSYTFSFMNEDHQIYVWGSFGIPINGSKKANLTVSSNPFQESAKLV